MLPTGRRSASDGHAAAIGRINQHLLFHFGSESASQDDDSRERGIVQGGKGVLSIPEGSLCFPRGERERGEGGR